MADQTNKEWWVRAIIEGIGDNPEREGLKETPKRVVKMWSEIFRGYDPKQMPNITTFKNGYDGIMYDEIITDEGPFFSHCEHHMVSFLGRYFFGYVPDKKILGLSKVARVVDYFSAKLQVQERLTTEIVDAIDKEVKSKGMILIMEGRHLCKEMRGVKKVGGLMRTSKVVGLFKTQKDMEQKFIQMFKK